MKYFSLPILAICIVSFGCKDEKLEDPFTGGGYEFDDSIGHYFDYKSDDDPMIDVVNEAMRDFILTKYGIEREGWDPNLHKLQPKQDQLELIYYQVTEKKFRSDKKGFQRMMDEVDSLYVSYVLKRQEK